MILDGKRIFFVEDDHNNIAVIKTILEQNGATTAFERWGNETLDKLQAFAPVDIILLDLMLPRDVSGYDLLEAIRAIEAFAQTPIVAVSAADPAVAMKKAKLAGFDSFISKPLQWGLFEQQIAAIMDGEAVWYAK